MWKNNLCRFLIQILEQKCALDNIMGRGGGDELSGSDFLLLHHLVKRTERLETFPKDFRICVYIHT